MTRGWYESRTKSAPNNNFLGFFEDCRCSCKRYFRELVCNTVSLVRDLTAPPHDRPRQTLTDPVTETVAGDTGRPTRCSVQPEHSATSRPWTHRRPVRGPRGPLSLARSGERRGKLQTPVSPRGDKAYPSHSQLSSLGNTVKMCLLKR